MGQTHTDFFTLQKILEKHRNESLCSRHHKSHLSYCNSLIFSIISLSAHCSCQQMIDKLSNQKLILMTDAIFLFIASHIDSMFLNIISFSLLGFYIESNINFFVSTTNYVRSQMG